MMDARMIREDDGMLAGAAAEEEEEELEGSEHDHSIDVDEEFRAMNAALLEMEEELEEEENPEELPLPDLMSQDDPQRMRMTRDELQWALEAKDAVELMPDLDDLPDFMYSQLVINTRGDIDDAVYRAEILQVFKQEYSILDTLEDGCKCLRELVSLFPGLYLSFGFSEGDGRYVLVHDLSKMRTDRLTSERKLRDFFAGVYYLCHALTPDFESSRKGNIGIIECGKLSWKHKPEFRVLQKLFRELMAVYPNKETAKPYNAGVFFNLMASILKKLMPQEVRDNFIETGLTSDYSLDHYFLVPNPAEAKKRMLQNMEDTLKRRYNNQESFSLE